MADAFSRHEVGVRGPFTGGAAVTPSDTTDLPDVAAALWVGAAGSGALKVTTTGGDDLTFAGVPVGRFDLVRVKRVWATGTGVSSIVALTR
jgi:hypothetical protein